MRRLSTQRSQRQWSVRMKTMSLLLEGHPGADVRSESQLGNCPEFEQLETCIVTDPLPPVMRLFAQISEPLPPE